MSFPSWARCPRGGLGWREFPSGGWDVTEDPPETGSRHFGILVKPVVDTWGKVTLQFLLL